MTPSNNIIKRLLTAIQLEEKEEINRYSLNEKHTLKSLKAEGLALHPIIITRKHYGYADYPEITFRIDFPAERSHFKDGAAIECFREGEEPVKGIVIHLEGKTGDCRLYAPDFPDWIEDDHVGIKIAPDQRTTGIMKTVMTGLENNKEQFELFEKFHGLSISGNDKLKESPESFVGNSSLNASQQLAVAAILKNEPVTIIHGPPGTGKTTTLAEAILQLVRAGEKVLVSAPSNTAVDNIAKRLIQKQLKVLRLGNTTKVDTDIFSHTPEGKLANSKQQKEIKELKKRAEEFRRMALKYKRSFGKSEREQRALLFREVKNIRTDIKKLQAYNEEKLFNEADVILGTPIGLYDADIRKISFNTLVIDEAGQCIEPLAWCIFPLAAKYIIAGDHLQLPPTVLSLDAAKLGLDRSILEVAINNLSNTFLLNTQYRMRKMIAGFSSNYFYEDLLQTPPHLHDVGIHLTFIDTAGSGNFEVQGTKGMSLKNDGELNVAKKLIERESLDPLLCAFISPYSGQADAAKELFPAQMRISTIDSFQGQEKEIVILSLVRSNEDGDIGFLKDYRRMNVAITRAQEQLFVIGDSATIGADPFYNAFLTYIEKYGSYRTCWEFQEPV